MIDDEPERTNVMSVVFYEGGESMRGTDQFRIPFSMSFVTVSTKTEVCESRSPGVETMDPALPSFPNSGSKNFCHIFSVKKLNSSAIMMSGASPLHESGVFGLARMVAHICEGKVRRQ